MSLLADDRAQAIQVGAVLLFAILILAFSMYQAFIVPEENRRVEFEHNQEVRGQLTDLRNAVVSTQGGAARATSVALGTEYPPRAIALNPPPASGTLETVGTTDDRVNLTVHNAIGRNETGDYWDGTPRNFTTGGLVYRPTYSRYEDAPTTGYEHTVRYDEFDEEPLVAVNQSFVDGTDLSLVTLNGSLQRSTSGTTAVDARPISEARRTVVLTGPEDGSPLVLNFTSRLSDDRWQRILSDQDHVRAVEGYPSAAGEAFTAIRVELDPTETYELQMTKAAVGTGATDEDAVYVTEVAGEGATVTRGNGEEITVEVRDAYNNPVADVPVNASVESGGSLDDDRVRTDADGRATFVYETTDGTPTGTHAVNVTIDDRSVLTTRPFPADEPDHVDVNVSVTAGGAYGLAWTDPSTEAENGGAALSDCRPDACTWDVGASSGDTLSLNATLDPAFDDIDVEYAVDDPGVATVSPVDGETEADGANQTALTAVGEGTVTVLASASDDSDVIEITLENVDDAGAATDLDVLLEDYSSINENEGNYLVSYEVSNAPTDFDKVSVHFVNNDDAQDTAWHNSTDTAGTINYEDGDAAEDSYDIEVAAWDNDGDRLDSWSTSDVTDGVNPGTSDDLGDASNPSFTSYTIEDQSSNGQQMRYRVSYETNPGSFDRVRGFLVPQNPDAGSDENTFTRTSVNNYDLSTYGFDGEEARDMKTSLLLFDDRNVVVERVLWVDGADGSGSTSG